MMTAFMPMAFLLSIFFGYGISGTPADCVKFATSVILKWQAGNFETNIFLNFH